VDFGSDVEDEERLPVDSFLQRMLRTDFRDMPPEWAEGEGDENSFGVGGRNADFRADFGGSLDLGVKFSTGVIEREGSFEDIGSEVVGV
jgi:hypothetical protein